MNSLKCPHCGNKIEVDFKIIQQIDKAAALKIKEREKLISELKAKLDDARNRAEVVSQQLQGEVQELILESTLRSLFPGDTITEVAKGANGADCVQIVRNERGQEIGKIIFESKRTKTFSSG